MEEQKDIVDTAVGLGSFPTLVTALQQDPAWVAMLKEAGPFTVFAPTEEAFAAGMAAMNMTAEQMLQDKAALGKLLTYHVVKGKAWMAADVMAAPSPSMVTTVEGHDLTIKHDDSGVWVNDAKVVQADVVCSNGVIHAIDKVLMPPTEAAPAALAMEEMPAETPAPEMPMENPQPAVAM